MEEQGSEKDQEIEVVEAEVKPRFGLRRLIFILFELLLICGTTALLIFGVFLVRIWHSPLQSETVTKRIVSEINRSIDSATISIDETEISFSQEEQKVIVKTRTLGINNNQGAEVAKVNGVILTYGISNLLHLSLVPQSLVVNQPQIWVVRDRSGSVGINLFNAKESSEEKSGNAKLERVLQNILSLSSQSLEMVAISDASLFYDDKPSGQTVVAPSFSMEVRKSKQGVIGFATATLELNEQSKTIQADISYDSKAGLLETSLGVEDFIMADIAPLLTPHYRSILRHWSVPMTGYVTLGIDRYGQITQASANLYGQEGELTLPPLYEAPLKFDGLDVALSYDPFSGVIDIEDIFIQRFPMSAAINGTVRPRDDQKGLEATINMGIHDLPVEYLGMYWSPKLASGAQTWITENMRDGVVPNASGVAKINLPMKEDGTLDVALDSFRGLINFENMTVDYFKPLQIAEEVAGRAYFDVNQFSIVLTQGHIGELNLKNGQIGISNLRAINHPDQYLSVNVQAAGPVSQVLSLADSDPLNFITERGIDPSRFSGQAETLLKIRLPLLDDLDLEQIEVTVESLVTNGQATDFIPGHNVIFDQMLVEVDTETMTARGPVKVGTVGPVRARWQEFFTPVKTDSGLVQSIIDIKGGINLEQLPFAMPDVGKDRTLAKGEADVDLSLKSFEDKSQLITAQIDIREAALDLPWLSYTKASGLAGRAVATLNIDTAGAINLTDLIYTSDLLTVGGRASFTSEGTLESLNIPTFKGPKQDIKVDAVRRTMASDKSKSGLDITIKGPAFNASGLFKSIIDGGGASGGDPLVLDMVVGRLYLSEEQEPLTQTQIHLERSVDGIEVFEMDSGANVEKNDIYVRYRPLEDRPGHSLRAEVRPAGDTLRRTDLTDSLVGGYFVLDMKSPVEEPPRLTGDIKIKDFKLVKAPVMARLLNALSPMGLIELLNGEGLTFSRAGSYISVKDGIITLKDGKMSGTSMGMSFHGKINLNSDELDLKGTVVPIRGVNAAMSKIPLIGNILTGTDGSGIFGATYTITGSFGETTVTVNPLSVLAPGIIRSILFE